MASRADARQNLEKGYAQGPVGQARAQKAALDAVQGAVATFTDETQLAAFRDAVLGLIDASAEEDGAA